MKTLFPFFLALLAPLSAFAHSAGECSFTAETAIHVMRDRHADPELRSSVGTCAVRNFLGQAEVAAALLHVVQDRTDDLFLREDLIEAFGDSHLRRRVKVEEHLTPTVGRQDLAAIDATVGVGAGRLLAAAQAVKSMDETEVVCPREAEFVRAISAIVRDPQSHVVLREIAVKALEKDVHQMAESKIFDQRTLRVAQESLAEVAGSGDNASYFSGASDAYTRLAEAGLPFFGEGEGRALASVSHQ